jgi:hypothetical protein
MIGGVSLETCWALYKYGIIKFWNIVASCWIFLYEHLKGSFRCCMYHHVQHLAVHLERFYLFVAIPLQIPVKDYAKVSSFSGYLDSEMNTNFFLDRQSVAICR